jgi:tRNA A37 threonylcarbamoyltransferase TsaD
VAEKIRIEMDSGGIQELLKSAGVQADLKSRADRIAAAGGPGMEAGSRIGKTRARASVITATRKARLAEANDRALTRALDAGRG